MDYQLITTNQALKEVCEQASTINIIALDTEFIRTRTYYPQLGLIQLYFGDVVTLIDPIAITDWSPFKDLLINPLVTKLLHACSEDLDVFMHEFGLLPQPLIDTQIVAAFVGHPISSGFATLVSEYLATDLDKSESRTDWLIRPLSEKQCLYAAADVFYLLPLADKLLKKATELNYLEAIQEEINSHCQKKLHVPNDKLAYLSISHSWQLNSMQLACLQKLTEWRLHVARTENIALNFVIREEFLLSIAQNQPQSLAELSVLGLKPIEIRIYGKTLLGLVKQAINSPESDWPKSIIRVIDAPGYKQNFKKIKELINQVAEQENLKSELIASRRQIDQYLKWSWLKEGNKPDLISGWRGRLLLSGLEKIN